MPGEYETPDFENMVSTEFVPSTRVPEEVVAMSKEAQLSTVVSEGEIKAKPFKIGDFDTSTVSTETSGFGVGLMTEAEQVAVDSRLASQWKDLSPHEQGKAIRKYLESRRDREQRPN